MSPMKHSRELSTEDVKYADANDEDDVPSDNRPYLHNPHLQLPRENATTLQDMLKREQHRADDSRGQSNTTYADNSFMRRTSSIGSNTTSKAGNVTSSLTTNSYIAVGDGYMHRNHPLRHSSSCVDVDEDADTEAGDKNKDESSSDNSSTKKKASSSQKPSRPRSSASSLSNNNRRSKTYPPSSSTTSASSSQFQAPSQPPLAVAGLPPPPRHISSSSSKPRPSPRPFK